MFELQKLNTRQIFTPFYFYQVKENKVENSNFLACVSYLKKQRNKK